MLEFFAFLYEHSILNEFSEKTNNYKNIKLTKAQWYGGGEVFVVPTKTFSPTKINNNGLSKGLDVRPSVRARVRMQTWTTTSPTPITAPRRYWSPTPTPTHVMTSALRWAPTTTPEIYNRIGNLPRNRK